VVLESDGQGVLNAPMGGPIFLMTKADTGTVTITLHNVLPQPHFEAGVDDDAAFASELAASTVPFAIMEETDILLLGHAAEIAASPDGFEEVVTTLGDLWRAEKAFSSEPGWSAPHMFFFDLRVEGGGAHSGNPAYLSHAWEIRATDPFWQTSFLGKWGFLHEAGHSFSNPGNPFFISGSGTYTWREGEPNLLNMAAVDAVFGDGSHEAWSGFSDAERQTTREAFVCDCLTAGGCDPTDFGTHQVVDFAMAIADDPAIGWDGLAGVYAAFTTSPDNWQDHIDDLAQVLSDETGQDFGPYMVAYQLPVSSSVLTAIDAAYPDWTGDPLAGLVCP
ncbi:MAG: M60 family metallopeptidase, partial [Myxococcales bacterium]|nr:M60 family metallopeptidase [Myxococcales bacterium]